MKKTGKRTRSHQLPPGEGELVKELQKMIESLVTLLVEPISYCKDLVV